MKKNQILLTIVFGITIISCSKEDTSLRDPDGVSRNYSGNQTTIKSSTGDLVDPTNDIGTFIDPHGMPIQKESGMILDPDGKPGPSGDAGVEIDPIGFKK